MPSIKVNPITSSNIAAIGHDKDSRLLAAVFNYDTSIAYVYEDVSEETYNAIMDSGSVGSGFHTHIRSQNVDHVVVDVDAGEVGTDIGLIEVTN